MFKLEVENTFDTLLKKFSKITNKGYIKSVTPNKNGSGITLENELGSTGGDFCIPDYRDIEIKAIRDYYDALIGLFSSAPDGKYESATQWLCENYGTQDENFKDVNVLSCSLKGKRKIKVGNYYFSIKIDYINQKIFLNIYDKRLNFLNNDIYWDFDSLEEKLRRKMSKLAIITVKSKIYNSDRYYHYKKINLYKLKSFATFLKLIEDGIILISFKTGVYKSGKYIGKFHDHGTTFRISKKDIEKLYDKIY